MKVVSFYCDVDNNTFYSDCARGLVDNLNSLGVDHVIKHQEFGTTWIANVCAKPTFLRQMMDELQEGFIWLDVDCRLIKKIQIPDMNKWGFMLRDDGSPHDFVHYVPFSPESIKFVEKWIDEVENKKVGSHGAFIALQKEIPSQIITPGYFQLGLSNVDSKNSFLKSFFNVR